VDVAACCGPGQRTPARAYRVTLTRRRPAPGSSRVTVVPRRRCSTSPPNSWQAPIPLSRAISHCPGPGRQLRRTDRPHRVHPVRDRPGQDAERADPDDSGWTQALVHQDYTDQNEIDSYRVQVSVLDANDAPVAYTQAQITTHRRALRLSTALPLD
jgi:hypothetical protein